MPRTAVQTLARAGAVKMLTDYATSASLKLQVYPARPLSIFPPTAFVDAMRETLEPWTTETYQRRPSVEVLVIHGLFDSKEAADQRDAFVDGFIDWVTDEFHGFGPNSVVAPVSVDDEPAFSPNWGPEAQQARVYYATRITLEGDAS